MSLRNPQDDYYVRKGTAEITTRQNRAEALLAGWRWRETAEGGTFHQFPSGRGGEEERKVGNKEAVLSAEHANIPMGMGGGDMGWRKPPLRRLGGMGTGLGTGGQLSPPAATWPAKAWSLLRRQTKANYSMDAPVWKAPRLGGQFRRPRWWLVSPSPSRTLHRKAAFYPLLEAFACRALSRRRLEQTLLPIPTPKDLASRMRCK